MKTLTKDDIDHHEQTIELPDGFSILIETPFDESHGAPWEDCDGHGPVSEWTTRDKRAGERLLHTDHNSRRYYDFAAAVKEAKRDGWDAKPYHVAFPNETKAQKAVRAVEADFEYLRSWCAEEWTYVRVVVTLRDENGREVANDSLWGVESYGDYWQDVAAEMANNLIAAHAKETEERAHWEARDTVTA